MKIGTRTLDKNLPARAADASGRLALIRFLPEARFSRANANFNLIFDPNLCFLWQNS